MKNLYKQFFLASLLSLSSFGAASAQSECVDFFQGQSNFDSPEIIDVVIFNTSFEKFWTVQNNTLLGFSEFDRIDQCYDGETVFRLNNVSMHMKVEFLRETYRSVIINFCDMGGDSNISSRSIQPPDYIGDIEEADGKEIPSENGSVTNLTVSTQTIRGGVQGSLTYTGEDLSYLVLGGQELFLHSICVEK